MHESHARLNLYKKLMHVPPCIQAYIGDKHNSRSLSSFGCTRYDLPTSLGYLGRVGRNAEEEPYVNNFGNHRHVYAFPNPRS